MRPLAEARQAAAGLQFLSLSARASVDKFKTDLSGEQHLVGVKLSLLSVPHHADIADLILRLGHRCRCEEERSGKSGNATPNE